MEQLSKVCFTQKKHFTAFFVFIFLLSYNTEAQNRNFSIVYSENLRGGSTIFGNTLMAKANADGTINTVAMNGNSVNGNSIYDNGDLGSGNMQYVDIDGTSGDGAGTRNSSSADLILPAGTNTIKMARLYWGGRAVSSQFNITQTANQIIKIRKGNSGPYQQYAAGVVDKTTQNAGLATEYNLYQAFTDITALIQQEGAGTYTVGNGAFSTGAGGDFGNYGAWSIVVVYENPALNFNSVRVFDGYQQVYNGGSAVTNSITLSGLNAPSGALASTDAVLDIMAWEGDARYTGDFFRINGSAYSNGINQPNNFWNGTISKNGVHVTSKFPNYTDQMGIDIDEMNVGTGYGILPNASSVSISFGTTQDQYFSGIVTFVIRMKDPIIKIVKTVTDANANNVAEAGETLTYKFKGKNIGAGNANNIILSDSLPGTVTYKPGSLMVNYSPGVLAGVKTDLAADDIAEYNLSTKTARFRLGNGATSTQGGFLALADSFEVQLQVTVNLPVTGNVPPIVNVARMVAKSDALVDYIDDGTASLSGGAEAGPLPVTLTYFTANLISTGLVKVSWSTSMEINNSKFEIERSYDGVAFNVVATKAGSGNSSLPINYYINDDVSSVSAPVVYYRLKQIDFDGKATLSNVVAVKLQKIIKEFTISPNPFQNNINIGIEWPKNENTIIKVFNVTGSLVVSKNVNMIRGYNYITMEELANVSAGTYIIQLTTATGQLYKQVIKQQ
jgi:uncharacterized repeat protein (TIGR01451 family)